VELVHRAATAVQAWQRVQITAQAVVAVMAQSVLMEQAQRVAMAVLVLTALQISQTFQLPYP
jgi:hypothetical protein